MSSSAGKENVFAAVIEFVKQVDDIHNHVFLPTQQKPIVLKEQAHLAIRDLDAIPIEKRQSKEDHAMYLYLRGKLLIVTSGYNQEAAQHLTNALKLKKNIVDAWICLGTCVWERGHLDKAKICYKCGLEQDPNNKEILHHLSAVGRKLCEGETDVENQEEIISESIKHAKDAIGQDVHDGLSWYASFKQTTCELHSHFTYILGNACLTAYFLTGTGDHDMLFQSLKAYKNAAKDNKMQGSVELCYNSSMTYMFLEDYWMALAGFERAGLMDPSCKSLRQTLNLRDVLDNIDSLLKKMNDAKGIPSPTSSLASVELDPSYERATVDRLTEGLNEGKTVTGKVLFSVENRSKGPIYYIVCDYNRNCFVITIYGVRRTAQYQFNSVRVDLLRQLCVNGAIVSPEHAIHRSMYTEFMEG
ncbi:hypothetical protein K7X08_022150 [Anisodus acutangulus]|uniref:Tetratricopeptide repeat protein 5 OB fold domain-containing protein n=1 Tax=Anisodus acutangulus TaxID=402998 RepID=A0A9Q1L4M0_9SOLA|nr:hypothetical protein K7X08_022150 [Anisodus acutangulus]